MFSIVTLSQIEPIGKPVAVVYHLVASTCTPILVLLNHVSGQPWSWLQLLAMIVMFSGVALLAHDTAIDEEVGARDVY